MKKPERIPEYLQHIIVACNRVRRYAESKTEQQFVSELLIQDAILRAVQIIGEASVRVRMEDPQFYELHKLEGFTRAIGLRNRLAHEYDDVDLKVTWGAVTRSVPAFREKVIDLLYEMGHTPDLDSLHF